MAIIKCKMCGGDLAIEVGATVAECEYCGSKQTVPSADSEKKLTLFSRANRLRIACEFDKAAGVYESIISEFPQEAEAYWGLVLCKYGIEYVDDPATGKKIPTCHRSSFESVMDDTDFEQALENADTVARKVYRDEAKQIEEIRKGIIEVSGKEAPYDIFICYKETSEDGQRTLDSVIAQDVYDALTTKGYRVFFARISLEDKLGQEYEPYIFAALNSAKIMLAFGTDYEYYNAVWVKNEWSRFLKLMAKDKSKYLIPCYKGIDAYDMPKEFAKLQAQDMGKIGAIQDLLRGIEKLLSPKISTSTVFSQQPADNVSAMVTRGQFALEDSDFLKAAEYFERALDQNPQEGSAYLGKVLASFRLKTPQEINDCLVKLDDNKDFERAIRFSAPQLAQELKSIRENANKKYLVKCLTVGLQNIRKAKEGEELYQTAVSFMAKGTFVAYKEAENIFTSAYNRRLAPTHFSFAACEAVRRQKEVMLLFMDGQPRTLSRLFMQVSHYPALMHRYPTQETLQKDLKEMLSIGALGIISDTSPVQYCMKSAIALREEEKKKSDYEQCVAFMNDVRVPENHEHFLKTSQLFAALGDYENAKKFSAECMTIAQDLKTNFVEQEAERKALYAEQEAKQKVLRERRAAISSEIEAAAKCLREQKEIYSKNSMKLFGEGARLKKAAKEEIERLEAHIAELRKQL